MLTGLLPLLVLGGGGGAGSGAHVAALRCEYRVNPLGMDVSQPRLSWILESGRRGEKQTAYQVEVADSEAALRADRGDLWDSGKVPGDQSAHVVYGGKGLRSGQRAWWRVRVWDKEGRASAWSAPNWWEMGLLTQSDWKAQWIGGQAAAESTAERNEDVRWIWYPEGNPRASAPAGERYFRASFDVPAEKKVKEATLAVVVDNSFVASINGTGVGTGGGWQGWHVMSVTRSLHSGKNLVAILGHNDSEGPAGLAAVLKIAYTDGTTQRAATGAGWKASNAPADKWMTASYDDSAWKSALAFARLGEAPWDKIEEESPAVPPPYLRKSFSLDKPIKRARIYASALGLYKLYVNGSRISTDLLTPGWTDYRKRVQYQTYDVTKALKPGDNALGLAVGDGWYAGYVGFGHRNHHYGLKPYALAQLEVQYADGTTQTVVSDGSWKTATGPLQMSDMLMGETYDARQELSGWASPGFNDAAWKAADAQERLLSEDAGTLRYLDVAAGKQPATRLSSGPLVAQYGPTVQAMLELRPKKITEKPGGAFVFDMGQNMVGWARLKVKGAAGTTVTLRFAEMLNPDGTVYTTNLRSARATDTYTLKGGGTEVYEPNFTFHGFRYVEVTGYPGKPGMEAITGIVIRTAAPQTGTFECSNPMVNQLQHNILWGQMGNYLEVPTDCPQRDERLGWMGDAQIFVRTGCFNMDIAGFMTKWTQDVVDAQSTEGGFSDVAPRLVDPSDGAPAWGDAGIIVPWTIYQCYGDTRLIERRYNAMAAWIEYIHNPNPDLIWRNRANNNFGDWLSIGADTPRDVLATAYFAYDASLMAKMAHAIGKEEDARKYSALFEGIKEAFNRAFVAPDGRIKGNTQTCYVLALRFGLLPESLRAKAAGYLVEDIEKRDWHLSTGFVGVGYLTPTLTQTGHLDVAYRLLNNDTFPSWGYSIKQGATTIWERWDGWTQEKGFQDPGMNSFNHYSLGSVGEWMYKSVAGIDLDPDQPGYKHILLHPRPGGGLTYAKASYNSLYGKIVSEWHLEEGGLWYHIEVPANTTATVFVPAKDAAKVKEGLRKTDTSAGVHFLRMEDSCAVYEVGSGSYTFATQQ